MKLALQVTGLVVSTAVLATAADRIDHEGRILGPAPVVNAPMLFNTPGADTVLSAIQVLPVNHLWNEDDSRRPLLPDPSAMIAQILADLFASRRTLRVFFEMNLALVPDDQPPVSIACLTIRMSRILALARSLPTCPSRPGRGKRAL
jgi:hypothetical protein